MTEAEWLACTDPQKMLEAVATKASDRKLRLFTCAYARRVWGLLKSRRKTRSFEIVERYVDGEGSPEDLRAAYNRVERWKYETPDPIALGVACLAPLFHPRGEPDGNGLRSRGLDYTLQASRHTAMKLYRHPDGRELRGGDFPDRAARDEAIRPLLQVEQSAQADLLRDILGPLSLRSVSIDPTVLRWNDGTVPRLAQAMYDSRDFGNLPILADAILDAGCDDEELMTHCRSGSDHVRGCWALDLLLGKM